MQSLCLVQKMGQCYLISKYPILYIDCLAGLFKQQPMTVSIQLSCSFQSLGWFLSPTLGQTGQTATITKGLEPLESCWGFGVFCPYPQFRPKDVFLGSILPYVLSSGPKGSVLGSFAQSQTHIFALKNGVLKFLERVVQAEAVLVLSKQS